MNSEKLNDWLNLCALVGVLIGLVFVGYELKQNNELAQAETVRELFAQDIARMKFQLDGDFLPLSSKAINDPDSLTDDEIARLDKYFQIEMQNSISIVIMYEYYGLATVSPEQMASSVVEDVLVGRFARGWFAVNEYWIADWSAEFADAIKQEFAEVPVQMEDTYPSLIRSSTEKVTDGM